MNENVSIKDGNITRKFAPIDKVKVDNTDGTQSIWVPEDDLKTGVLYASDNGIYIASEDGYDAYSEVVIRVEKRIDDGDLIDESDTDWKDIDFDGDIGDFDELDNWDVDTLEEFSDDLEGFDDLFNDEDKWDEEKEKPITEDEMGDFDGDSLSGIDPETGNEMEVSLDEDGFLDEEVLPSSIAITRSPFRLTYIDGESISFVGIQVTAYTEDGNVWNNTNYPNGIIPNGELEFPIKKAHADIIYEKYKSDIVDTSIPRVPGYTRTVKYNNVDVLQYEEHCITTGVYYKTSEESGNVFSVLATKQDGGVVSECVSYNYITGEIVNSSSRIANQSYTHNNKTAYYSSVSSSSFAKLASPLPIIPKFKYDGPVAWTLLYGDKDENGTQTIPVNWTRPDGVTLETSYQITVISSGEGGGGSDDEWDGNISYGGNDYMLNPNSVVGLSYDHESKKVIAPNIGEYNVNQAIDVELLIPKE